MKWENVIKITSWTPPCPACGTPMEKKQRTHSQPWKLKDRATFICPNCGHKEVF